MRRPSVVAGLGDPLLGPSAIEAVASGVMFINPEYDEPKQGIYHSQHPFLKNQVCSLPMTELWPHMPGSLCSWPAPRVAGRRGLRVLLQAQRPRQRASMRLQGLGTRADTVRSNHV